MSKYNRRVEQLLNEAGWLKAAAKTAAKGVGTGMRKLVNPAAWLQGASNAVKGAQAVANAPANIGKAVKGAVVDNDYSPLSNALGNMSQKLGNFDNKATDAITQQRAKDTQAGDQKTMSTLQGFAGDPRAGNNITLYDIPGVMDGGSSTGTIKQAQPYKDGFVYTANIKSNTPNGPDTANIVYSKGSPNVQVFFSKKNVPMPDLTINTYMSKGDKGGNAWSILSPRSYKSDNSVAVDVSNIQGTLPSVGAEVTFKDNNGKTSRGTYLGFNDPTGKSLRVIRK
jgi:hypothetical protein